MNAVLFITDLLSGSRVPVLAGIRASAARHGWHVEPIEVVRLRQPVAEVLAYWKPAGCILEGSADKMPDARDFAPTPLVHIDPGDRVLDGSCPFSVENDDEAIAELAHRELVRAGCEEFAFVGWSRRNRWSRRRGDRFARLVALTGRVCRVLEDPWTLGNKNEFFARLTPFVSSLPKPCGIFAANDAVAEAVLDACRQLGTTVPGEAMVVGADDNPDFCDSLRPSLTSVRPDFRRAGFLAAEMLARRVRNPSEPCAHVKYAPLGVTPRLSTRRLAVVGKRVADALDLIRREACSGLKAADVVRAMGVTERLAETRFRAATGRRITEEIADVRLERVLEYLRDPAQEIGAIANLCGWDADSYLKRLFKRKFGMTMREWRDRNREAAR